jgi:hypothetical protein
MPRSRTDGLAMRDAAVVVVVETAALLFVPRRLPTDEIRSQADSTQTNKQTALDGTDNAARMKPVRCGWR